MSNVAGSNSVEKTDLQLFFRGKRYFLNLYIESCKAQR